MFWLKKTHTQDTLFICVSLTHCFSHSHTLTHTSPLLTALHYTRRSTRAAKVLMDVLPSSAGGLQPPGASSCRGLKPPSVCRLSRSLAAASASPSITTIAKPTRHGASTAATRELYGARSVCGGSHTHTGKMLPDDPISTYTANTSRNTPRIAHTHTHVSFPAGREAALHEASEGFLMTCETC